MAPERILVVEDNEQNMELVEYLLEEKGYEVHKATNGEDALNIIGKTPLDLVLMDIHLPGIDGISLVRQLRQDPATETISIVALTAHAMKGDRERFLRAGCDGYIPKPIDVKEFIPRVETFLHSRRPK